VAVTNCWMTAVAISAFAFCNQSLKASTANRSFHFLLLQFHMDLLYPCTEQDVLSCKSRNNFHIVCSCTKEYKSYKSTDLIISKFAGQRSCYPTSGVCPSPVKVAWWKSFWRTQSYTLVQEICWWKSFQLCRIECPTHTIVQAMYTESCLLLNGDFCHTLPSFGTAVVWCSTTAEAATTVMLMEKLNNNNGKNNC